MTSQTTSAASDQELVAAARAAIDAHGDGQVHTVAAAVRDEHGRIHVGVNFFHFTGGPCAELVALATARTAGARAPQAIVAVGDAGRGVLAPCGRDRQVMADHHPDITVLVPTSVGLMRVTAAELLPHTYSWADQGVQRLRFSGWHLEAVRAGTKRVTMRFEDPVQVGPALLVFDTDQQVALPGRIISTVARKVTDVSDAEARADGFCTSADVLPALRDYYPNLQGDDEIVIVSFDVDPGTHEPGAGQRSAPAQVRG